MAEKKDEQENTIVDSPKDPDENPTQNTQSEAVNDACRTQVGKSENVNERSEKNVPTEENKIELNEINTLENNKLVSNEKNASDEVPVLNDTNMSSQENKQVINEESLHTCAPGNKLDSNELNTCFVPETPAQCKQGAEKVIGKDNVPTERYIKRSESKLSNYYTNIKMLSSGLMSEKDKESQQLTAATTVARFSPVWKQTLTSSAAILLTFTAGLTSGYSAILLPQLKEPGSIIPLDESTASWIAAMAALPMAPGCLISGWMMEKFGRKTSHYIVCAPFLLGWILIACARDLSLMLLGRFFTGLCVGLLGPLGPVYIGETTEPKYRGFFLAAVSLAIAVGILVAHLIGTFMTWQWTATISCLFPILSVVLLALVPESPTWLIAKGQTEDGIKSYYWLRGYGEEAKAELKGLLDKQKVVDSEPEMSMKEKLINLKSPELLKPLFIMIVFFVTCQFSGVNAIAFYSIEIVEKAVGKGMDHYLAMLVIDALRVVMSVVACVICKMYGRRPLCFISGIWTALSMVALSMYLYWTDGKATNMSWLPLTCLSIYITAISIGLVPLPWIMCGEVFPTRVRGLGSGISSAMTFVAFFIVVKTAPGMMSNLGEEITFLFYGIIALIGTIVLFFILPETKGKSLQEIEDKFRSKKSDPVV